MLERVEPGTTTAELDEIGGCRLRLGQVIAIEPFLSTRSAHVTEAEDGWTLVGHPESRSAQFEHTVIVTNGEPIVATRSERSG